MQTRRAVRRTDWLRPRRACRRFPFREPVHWSNSQNPAAWTEPAERRRRGSPHQNIHGSSRSKTTQPSTAERCTTAFTRVIKRCHCLWHACTARSLSPRCCSPHARSPYAFHFRTQIQSHHFGLSRQLVVAKSERHKGPAVMQFQRRREDVGPERNQQHPQSRPPRGRSPLFGKLAAGEQDVAHSGSRGRVGPRIREERPWRAQSHRAAPRRTAARSLLSSSACADRTCSLSRSPQRMRSWHATIRPPTVRRTHRRVPPGTTRWGSPSGPQRPSPPKDRRRPSSAATSTRAVISSARPTATAGAASESTTRDAPTPATAAIRAEGRGDRVV